MNSSHAFSPLAPHEGTSRNAIRSRSRCGVDGPADAACLANGVLYRNVRSTSSGGSASRRTGYSAVGEIALSAKVERHAIHPSPFATSVVLRCKNCALVPSFRCIPRIEPLLVVALGPMVTFGARGRLSAVARHRVDDGGVSHCEPRLTYPHRSRRAYGFPNAVVAKELDLLGGR